MEQAQSTYLYSVPATDPKDAIGETPIYRNPKAFHGLTKGIARLPHITTMQQLFEHSAKEYSGLDCMGSRIKNEDGSLGEYRFKSYKTTFELAKQVGSAILKLDLAPVVQSEGDPDCRFISIFAKNSEEWLLLDIASWLYGFTVVPIYDALGLDSLPYLYEQTNVTNIFTGASQLERLINEAKQGKLNKLTTIVCLEAFSENVRDTVKGTDIKLLSWQEFIAHGEEILPLPQVTPDTILTLAYTSGTTGNPKGVLLSHANMIATIGGTENQRGMDLSMITKGDVHISYLPISHIFERVFVHQILCRGCKIGFFSGDIQKLKDDLEVLRPTYMLSVPRLYNKYYENIRTLINKNSDPNSQEALDISVLNQDLIKEIRSWTGGRVKIYYTGSAPISPHVLEFLKKAFRAPFAEGMGQTETCSACFIQRDDETVVGSIGGPFTSVEFKFVDVPEMNYTSSDIGKDGVPMPRGELCIRGNQIFKGYYKQPERTAEAFDEQGWLHTGDIAMLLPNGSIKLIDRRKNIFKMAQGEYVAPEKIEQVYLSNDYVAEAYVYGDSLKSQTVAIVVPPKEKIMQLASELGLKDKSFEELCQDSTVVRKVLDELRTTGKASGLAGYEIARNVHLEPQSFAALGLTTPSLKLQRNVAKKYYNDVIEKLYQ